MEAKMLWGPAFLLIIAAMCPVLVADPIDTSEPGLRILARTNLFNEGERKAVFCQANNLPEPVWYTPSGKRLALSARRETKDNTVKERVSVERPNQLTDELHRSTALVFQNATIPDTGNWLCKSGDYNVTFNLIVGRKVNITNRNVEKHGDEDRSVKFECEADGEPTPVVKWYKGAKLITADGSNKYSITTRGITHYLEIMSLTYEDAGEYVCKVTQNVLSHYIDKTFALSVKHAPVLHTAETVETYGILNEVKNLSCSAHAFPLPAYRWYRTINNHDTEITEEEAIFRAEDGEESILSLKLRTEKDLGQYKCKISNSKGFKTVLFDISLGSKPPVPDNITLLSSNDSALTFDVTCSQCNFVPETEGIAAKPENLTVIGFQFQLTRVYQGYLPDWDKAYESFSEVTEDQTYVVSGLPNTTEFHVRVRSLNSAGYSDWLEASEHPSTTSFGVQHFITCTLLIAALFMLY